MAVRTLRSIRIVALVGVLLSVLGAGALTLLMSEVDTGGMTATDHVVLAVRLNLALPVVVLAVASAVGGADLSRGLVVVPIMRARGRTALWRVRWCLALLVGAGTGALMAVLDYVVVGLVAGFAPLGGVWIALVGAMTQGAGWASLGLGLGFLVRGAVPAVAIPMILAYVCEPVLRSLVVAGPLGEALGSVAPFAAATSLVRSPEALSTAFDPGGALPWLRAAVTFLVPAAAVAVIGWIRFARADLSPRSVD